MINIFANSCESMVKSSPRVKSANYEDFIGIVDFFSYQKKDVVCIKYELMVKTLQWAIVRIVKKGFLFKIQCLNQICHTANGVKSSIRSVTRMMHNNNKNIPSPHKNTDDVLSIYFFQNSYYICEYLFGSRNLPSFHLLQIVHSAANIDHSTPGYVAIHFFIGMMNIFNIQKYLSSKWCDIYQGNTRHH